MMSTKTELTAQKSDSKSLIALCESLHRIGQKRLYEAPPLAKSYWMNRYWDREKAEQHPILGSHYRSQRIQISQYIKQFYIPQGRYLDLACGTGVFTEELLGLSHPAQITAMDISIKALSFIPQHHNDTRIKIVEGDFWELRESNKYDVIFCVDAIHHLGYVENVTRRISQLLEPKGFLIGNVWTSDHFHEFQIKRYGKFLHLYHMLRFAYTGLVRTSDKLQHLAYRTHLISSYEAKKILQDSFIVIKHLKHDRYFSSFVVQV